MGRFNLVTGIKCSLTCPASPVSALAKSLFSAQAPFKPLNTGHRGFNGKYPENTMASFDAAVGAGAEVVELDVQVSADGVVVVSHDPNTLRCFGVDHEITKTAFKGVLENLSIENPDEENDHGNDNDDAKSTSSSHHNYTAEQKQELSEAMNKKAKNLVSPQRIPTFEQVARKFATDPAYANVRLMIDIKMTNEPWVVPKLVEILQQVNPDINGFWVPRTVLGIWRLDVLRAAEEAAPDFPVAHIGVSRSLARQFMKSTQVKAISLHHIALTAGSGGLALINQAKAHNRLVYTWTVNTVPLMKWAVAANLDGVITDYPDLFESVRNELTPEVVARDYAPAGSVDRFVSWGDRYSNWFQYMFMQAAMFVKMSMLYLEPAREVV